MADLKGAIIINSQVGCGHLDNALNYIQRLAGYGHGEGIDREPTQQDLHLEQIRQKAGEKNIAPMLSYAERTGRFKSLHEEKPLIDGEISGGLWNREGLTSSEEVKRSIIDSGSEVMRSIVTVERKWAPVLGLQTKEDFQALLRSTWDKHVERWGIIPQEDIRWAAAFHTDAKNSVHCHIFTWSANGENFPKGKSIPQKNIRPSNQIIRDVALKNIKQERSAEKNFLRNALIAETKSILGIAEPGEGAAIAIRSEELGIASRSSFSFPDTSKASLNRLLERCMGALPIDGIGRVTYNNVSVDAKAAANLIRQKMLDCPGFKALYTRWEEQTKLGADINGLTGKIRDKYISDGMADIRDRIDNVILKYAASRNNPWQRSSLLIAKRQEAIAHTLESCYTKSTTYRIDSLKSPESLNALAYKTIKECIEEPKVKSYIDSVAQYAKDHHKVNLKPEQIERLKARAERDLIKTCSSVMSSHLLDAVSKRNTQTTSIATRQAIWQSRGDVPSNRNTQLISLDAKERRFIKENLVMLQRSFRLGRWSEQAENAIASFILKTPEISSRIQKEVALGGKMQDVIADKREAIRVELANTVSKQKDLNQATPYAIVGLISLLVANISETNTSHGSARALTARSKKRSISYEIEQGLNHTSI